MLTKPVHARLESDLIDKIDAAVKNSGGVITSRTHYLKLSAMEKLARDGQDAFQEAALAMEKFGEATKATL